MLGVNDRSSLRERAPAAKENVAPPDGQHPPPTSAAPPRQPPSATYEFHSDKWAELYSKRIDDMIATLKARGVPIMWVGLPAIRGTKPTSDMSYLDELYRARADKAEIVYVDIWDGFVDDQGRFTQDGPDFEGQTRRLRTYDGVNFTKAGAEKLGHYVEHDLRRLLGGHVLPVIDRIFFPDKSGQIPDVAHTTLVVLPPDHAAADKATRSFVDAATKEHGSSARTFKSGLIWAVSEGADSLRDEARKVLAWEDIADEETDLRLDEGQQRQLAESLKKAQRDIKETVWRAYKNVMLLAKDGEWKIVDLGLVHSSAAPSISQLIVERLVQAGDIEDRGVSPNFLVRNWPPAFKEWNTRSVRDAFFASPQFPRLLNPDSIKDTIARGVENGMLGYVAKKTDGGYAPFHWNSSLSPQDVEISDDVFLIQRELAEAYKAGKISTTQNDVVKPTVTDNSGTTSSSAASDGKSPISASIPRLVWNGEVPHQKWMNFYTKVLAKFAAGAGLKITLRVEVAPVEGVSPQKVDETRVALRELGLKDSFEGE
jgi:lysophospholipase L1-like esterase